MDCTLCSKTFKHPKHCYRHMRQTHGVDPLAEKKKGKGEVDLPATTFNFSRDVERNIFECRECSQVFSSRENRDAHEVTHNQHRPFKCSKCTATFKKHVHRKMHERTCQSPSSYHGTGLSQDDDQDDIQDDDEFRVTKSALKGVVSTYSL